MTASPAGDKVYHFAAESLPQRRRPIPDVGELIANARVLLTHAAEALTEAETLLAEKGEL